MANEIGKMHFRRMDEGTDEDFAVLARVHEKNIRKLPDLLLGILTNLKADEAYRGELWCLPSELDGLTIISEKYFGLIALSAMDFVREREKAHRPF